MMYAHGIVKLGLNLVIDYDVVTTIELVQSTNTTTIV